MKKRRPFATLRNRITCYFAIALLPLLLILLYAYGAIVQKESAESLRRIATSLQVGVQSVDTFIDASEKAGITLFYDNRVKRHLKPIAESTTEDRAAQVEIYGTINSLTTITDEITQTMLLYLDDQYVFSDGLYSFDDYFNTLYAFRDYDTDFWRGLLKERMVMKMLPATDMEQKRVNTVHRVIPVVYTTQVSGRRVVMVITLSVEDMAATVKNSLSVGGAQLVILDSEGRLVCGDFDPQILEADGSGGYEPVQLNQEQHHVLCAASEKNKLQYLLAVPDSYLFTMSDDYLLFIALALSMSVIAGALAIYFARKISRPIQHMYSSMDGKAEDEPKSLQEVSRRFSFFLSDYQEAKEEECSLRTNFVEMGVLRLLSGHDRHIQDLTVQLERECAFTDPVYQLCVAEVVFSQESGEMQDTERINMQLNFRSDLTAYLARSTPCLVLEDRPNQYICLANRSEDDDVLFQSLEQLLLRVREASNVAGMHVCLAQGCELKRLDRAYEQAMRTLACVSPEEPFALRRAEEGEQPSAAAFTLRDEMLLLSALRAGEREKALSIVNRTISACGQLGPGQEKLRIHDLFVTGMRYLAERDETLQDTDQYQGLRADVELPGGMEAKRQLLNRFYGELTEIQRIGTESNLTASIVSYVQEHYASDLYLERVAEGLGLSVKYISKVFKEKTGRNLSDYINEVRIQHVKDMLVNTNMSIASISEAAGIYSRTTLIRLFRKYEGVTPSEYRELVRSQKE